MEQSTRARQLGLALGKLVKVGKTLTGKPVGAFLCLSIG